MNIINSTDVRKEFNLVIDKAIQEKPQFFKRTRDLLILMDVNFLEILLSAYKFTAETIVEDDGSITLSLNEIDLIENAETKDKAKLKLAKAMLEYSEDYYCEFKYWSSSSNRKTHISHVIKILTFNDINKIAKLIEC
ncbi:MAG: hypothetical protein PHI05_04855 [Bacilli bacterium]|nr:hypothetical protein [Tissierellia bacterium]MDD4548050.1 hypothetical protein [Bacilli bacterium]